MGNVWENVEDHFVGGDSSWQPAFQRAIDALPTQGGTVLVPPRSNQDLWYDINTTIVVDKPGVRISCQGTGRNATSPRLVWTGAADDGPIIQVLGGMHGFTIERVYFDGASLARGLLHIDVAAGSLHDPVVSACLFADYKEYGLLLGADQETLSSGQLRNVECRALVFSGGPGNPDGIRLNAQNAEFVNLISPYFDPAVGSEHRHHIWQRAGGLNIVGMASTRADDYAIYAWGSQVNIFGWRSEDLLLLKWPYAALNGPCVIEGVMQRYSIPESRLATDPVIYIDAVPLDVSISLHGCRIYGSIKTAAQNADAVVTDGVTFGEFSDGTRGNVIRPDYWGAVSIDGAAVLIGTDDFDTTLNTALSALDKTVYHKIVLSGCPLTSTQLLFQNFTAGLDIDARDLRLQYSGSGLPILFTGCTGVVLRGGRFRNAAETFDRQLSGVRGWDAQLPDVLYLD